jgi:TPR repeat protein
LHRLVVFDDAKYVFYWKKEHTPAALQEERQSNRGKGHASRNCPAIRRIGALVIILNFTAMKFVLFVFCFVLSFLSGYSQVSKPTQPTAKELATAKSLATKGDVPAMLNMGQYYYYGTGVVKNYVTARQWLTKAATKNNVTAMLLLGDMYGEGLGIKRDTVKALEWIKKAAEKGSADAAYQLGEMYETGEGAPENLQEAVKWYKVAAEKGDADAMIALGFCYMEGDGVPEDRMAGYDWFLKAAAKGEPTAMRYIGDYFSQSDMGNDCLQAIDWYMKAADAGDSLSVKPVGVTITKDECPTADKAAIAAWMKKLADNNNPDACFYMGGFYVMGIGVKRSAAKGMEMLIKEMELAKNSGAERNFSTNNLFTLYNSGKLTEEHQQRLLTWFEQTAGRTNDDEMMSVIANIYINKEAATTADYKTGFEWATKSAERGNPGGCFWLGFVYSKGLGAIKKDDVKAFAWLLKSAQKGDTDAMRMVSTCYESGTGIEKNRAKANEWKVKADAATEE